MKSHSLFLLSLFVFVGCAQNKTIAITEVSQKDLKAGIVVDVRTPKEYLAGHLDNALNINWFDEDFALQVEPIEKTKTIYVYCKKGGRSAKAQEKMISLGFENVVDLAGGYDAFNGHVKE